MTDVLLKLLPAAVVCSYPLLRIFVDAPAIGSYVEVIHMWCSSWCAGLIIGRLIGERQYRRRGRNRVVRIMTDSTST